MAVAKSPTKCVAEGNQVQILINTQIVALLGKIGKRLACTSISGHCHIELPNEMSRTLFIVLYVVALIAVVVGVDVLFFRNLFWARLLVNIGIVLVFAAFYLRFLKKP